MGEVWTAYDVVLRRTVAVKILKAELLGSPEFVERFRAEARHAAALAHPGIASVFDYREDKSGAFLVMEFVPGEPLSTVLAGSGVPPLATTLSVLAQTAEALAAAHAGGVIHRDVKPGNLIILPDGTVKVTDFGIARAIDAAPLTTVGRVIGTPQYMSPEQASGGEITAATDIYSLGVVGYEMLAGRRPFDAENPLALALAHVNEPPAALPIDVPDGVRHLIERALSKSPTDRPDSAAAFAAELRALSSTSTRHQSSDQASGVPGGRARTIVAAPPTRYAAPAVEYAPTRVARSASSPPTDVMPLGSVPAPPLLVPDVEQSRQRRRSLLLALLATVLATLLVAGALAVAVRMRGSMFAAALRTGDTSTIHITTVPETTTTTRPAPTTTTVAGILVDPAVYVGMTRDDATKALEKLGLHVADSNTKGHGKDRDVVVGVEPNGVVPPKSTVTLVVGRQPEGD
jgi:serine/threonine-protein kinase